ncbi:MAG: acylphosphatase [Chloroflexi bacterium]|nr:acylphosphatase [Chloroflexota bacterium]MCY3685481.1 acylphosphatase [Chloroflexota bacterium]MDE2708383.1 acylphosphatase [Chloroflexota bacterium]
MVRMTVCVRGRVQMVGYRMFAEQTADRIGGIAGSVQNLPDGSSVVVVAEGPRASLEEFLDELKIGPAHALIREVEVEWGVANGEPAGFVTIA